MVWGMIFNEPSTFEPRFGMYGVASLRWCLAGRNQAAGLWCHYQCGRLGENFRGWTDFVRCGWNFLGILCEFSPRKLLGEMIQVDYSSIFQKGWDHQLYSWLWACFLRVFTCLYWMILDRNSRGWRLEECGKNMCFPSVSCWIRNTKCLGFLHLCATRQSSLRWRGWRRSLAVGCTFGWYRGIQPNYSDIRRRHTPKEVTYTAIICRHLDDFSVFQVGEIVYSNSPR